MKNKLLISSALAGGLVLGGSAYAQTTITGSLDLHYRSITNDGQSASTMLSRNGLGRETQLNIQNKGKLNNGLDYAAGFSLEFDGDTTAQTVGTRNTTAIYASSLGSITNENLYIDIIAGSTTLTAGIDHIQNSTRHSAPMIRSHLDDTGFGTAWNLSVTDQVGARTKEQMYVGIVQAIPGTGLNLSFAKAPQGGDRGGNDQTITVASSRNSSYEVGVVGVNAFDVKGLNLHAFKNKEAKSTSTLNDLSGTTYGIGYTFGQFGFGAEQMKQNRSSDTDTAETNMKATLYSATFAVDKNLTLGAQYTVNKIDNMAENEKIKSAQIGYSLGPVAVIGHYDLINGANGSTAASAEGKQLGVRLSTNF
jgi:hypothetical protein